MPRGNPSGRIWLVGLRPDRFEGKENYALSHAEGTFLVKAMKDTKIDAGEFYFTYIQKCPGEDNINICKRWFWNELNSNRPTNIICLGKEAVSIVTRQDITVKNYYPDSCVEVDFGWKINIWPCYSLHNLSNKGKKHYEIFKEFIKKVYGT